jgi:predicted RNA polymerase sigma factor
LGELYRHEDKSKAVAYLDKALQLAKTAPERAEIRRKIEAMQSKQ